jgi:hypothetical protein
MVLDSFDDDNDDDENDDNNYSDDVDNDDYDDDMILIDASIPIKMMKDNDNIIGVLLMMIVD